MDDISFIKLHSDKAKAQDLGESPAAYIRYTPQIQLLTKDPQPYLQVAEGAIGSSYKAYIVRCDNHKEVDATNHILINGDIIADRLVIRLAYLPWDFHTIPVYLKIDRFDDNTRFYYSNKFLLTRYKEELTSRIDYIDKTVRVPPFGIIETDDLGQFQSIRLQLYKNNVVDATDVETYYQITTSQTVNQRISEKEYIQWQTQLFNAWTLTRLARALYTGLCYINQTRNYIVEGLERAERESGSNISENQFLTDPDESNYINIIPVIIDDDWETIPFLASSSQLSSVDFLASQTTITIPIP